MKYIFPIKLLVKITTRNKNCTYGVFALCLFVSILKGYLFGNMKSPDALINFFDHWTGFTKNIFDIIVKLLYTPIGVIVWLLMIFFLFMWLLFIMSGIKPHKKIKDFILPFIGISYLGIIILAISFLLSSFSISTPYSIRMIIYLYWLTFYNIILIEIFKTTKLRSFSIISLSFIVVFLLGGFPSIAPYLQWI